MRALARRTGTGALMMMMMMMMVDIHRLATTPPRRADGGTCQCVQPKEAVALGDQSWEEGRRDWKGAGGGRESAIDREGVE
jgi:hypothetical protein